MFARSSFIVVVLVSTGCTAPEPNTEEEEDAPIAGSLFSQLQARFAGQVLAGGVELVAYQYGSQIPSAGINPQCTTLSGNTTDSDGDLIPLDGVLTLDCSKRLLGWSGAVAGTQSVADTQPNTIAWAFTMSADLEASVTGPAGGSAVNDTTGSLTASEGGAFGPYSLEAVLDATTLITTALGRELDVAESLDWTATYTPDITWTPGSGVVVTGLLDITGTWSVGVNGKVANATLSTPSPLIFDPECRPTRVTGGVVEAAFEFEGRMATITVEWTGCDSSSVTYDYDVGGT